MLAVQPAIAYLPADATGYFAALAPDFELLLQQGPDLGVRLDHALTSYLDRYACAAGVAAAGDTDLNMEIKPCPKPS